MDGWWLDVSIAMIEEKIIIIVREVEQERFVFNKFAQLFMAKHREKVRDRDVIMFC